MKSGTSFAGLSHVFNLFSQLVVSLVNLLIFMVPGNPTHRLRWALPDASLEPAALFSLQMEMDEMDPQKKEWASKFHSALVRNFSHLLVLSCIHSAHCSHFILPLALLQGVPGNGDSSTHMMGHHYWELPICSDSFKCRTLIFPSLIWLISPSFSVCWYPVYLLNFISY